MSSASGQLVSILIPAFNSAPFIAATVCSALEQSWQKCEIIVVDDGSTDDTLAIARSFESAKVKVISQRNAGACAARNVALACAQGDYIQFLDADDLLHPEKIRLQVAAASARGDRRVLLTGPFGVFLRRPWRSAFTPTALWHSQSPVAWLTCKFRDYVWMNPSSWLVSRQLVDAAGQWDESLSRDQDGEYVCRVVRWARYVEFVAGATAFYRVTGQSSLSRARSRAAYESILRSTQRCIGYLLDLEDSPITRSAGLQYVRTWYPHFYPEFPDLMRDLEALAGALGGELGPARLRGGYGVLEDLVGAEASRRASLILPAMRWTAKTWYEDLAYGLSRHRPLGTFDGSPDAVRGG